jgi:hypothetical protein
MNGTAVVAYPSNNDRLLVHIAVVVIAVDPVPSKNRNFSILHIRSSQAIA